MGDDPDVGPAAPNLGQVSPEGLAISISPGRSIGISNRGLTIAGVAFGLTDVPLNDLARTLNNYVQNNFELNPQYDEKGRQLNARDMELELDILNEYSKQLRAERDQQFDFYSPLPAVAFNDARPAFGFNAPSLGFPNGSTNFFGQTFANNPPSTSPTFGWTDTFTLTGSMGNSYGGGAVSGPGGVGLGGVFGGAPGSATEGQYSGNYSGSDPEADA